MRVLHLISSSGFYGAEAAIANLSVGLLRRGCGAVIGSLRNQGRGDTGFETRIDEMGLPIVDIPCSGRFDPGSLSFIRDYVRRNQIDVVHTHGYKADLFGYAATRHTGPALVATCHNWTGGSIRGRLYDFMDHLVLRQFPAIAAVSDPVRRSLGRFGVSDERIRVIPNGIDVERFSPNCVSPDAALRTGGPVVIGFVGRLAPEKGVDVLLRGAAGVLKRHPDTVIALVGDGPARAGLEKLSLELGIAGCVRFLGRQSNMQAVYSALDILALPSRNEGAPMTSLEAMAAGVAVVATRAGSLPSIVRDGKTGLLVGIDDVAGLGRALGLLLENPILRLQMGARARQWVAAEYSCDMMARRYLDLYETVLPSSVRC